MPLERKSCRHTLIRCERIVMIYIRAMTSKNIITILCLDESFWWSNSYALMRYVVNAEAGVLCCSIWGTLLPNVLYPQFPQRRVFHILNPVNCCSRMWWIFLRVWRFTINLKMHCLCRMPRHVITCHLVIASKPVQKNEYCRNNT